MDKSDNYESALQSLARTFRAKGTRWGDLRNMSEVPMFVDSRASRIVQIAGSGGVGRMAAIRVSGHKVL